MIKLVVDPPSGWRYGFPKEFTFKGSILLPGAYEEVLARWFIENGYPEKDVKLAVKHSRYWTHNEETTID